MARQVRTALNQVRAALIAGALAAPVLSGTAHATEEPKHSAALDDAIIAAAKRHGVPERLVRRIIMRESKYNARAHNRAFWGLMQISYPTAKSMGFKGTREELLNPFVNLRYAVPYLANAFVIAGRDDEAAVRLYAAGYYFTARSRGLLSALRTADSPPLSGIIDIPAAATVLAANAVVQPPQSIGIFGALFGPGRQPPPEAAPQTASQTADATPASAAPTSGADAKPAQAAADADAPKTGADMVADASGSLEPPKKWKRDGGLTVIARGEQAIEELAERAEGDATPGKGAQGRSAKAHRPHKITLVAALDLSAPSDAQPRAQAQAYAGAAAPDGRLSATPSQTAISNATGDTAPPSEPGTFGTAPVAPTSGFVSAENPTQYDEPDFPAKAKPKAKTKLAKHTSASDRKTRQSLLEKGPLATGRSEAH